MERQGLSSRQKIYEQSFFNKILKSVFFHKAKSSYANVSFVFQLIAGVGLIVLAILLVIIGK